jgi:hypothetical protein
MYVGDQTRNTPISQRSIPFSSGYGSKAGGDAGGRQLTGADTLATKPKRQSKYGLMDRPIGFAGGDPPIRRICPKVLMWSGFTS